MCYIDELSMEADPRNMHVEKIDISFIGFIQHIIIRTKKKKTAQIPQLLPYFYRRDEILEKINMLCRSTGVQCTMSSKNYVYFKNAISLEIIAKETKY